MGVFRALDENLVDAIWNGLSFHYGQKYINGTIGRRVLWQVK